MVRSKYSKDIALICYAYVSGLFATFSNPKFKGSNFEWSRFTKICVDHSEEWLYINNIRDGNPNKNDKILVKQYTEEIANNLVNRLKE